MEANLRCDGLIDRDDISSVGRPIQCEISFRGPTLMRPLPSNAKVAFGRSLTGAQLGNIESVVVLPVSGFVSTPAGAGRELGLTTLAPNTYRGSVAAVPPGPRARWAA